MEHHIEHVYATERYRARYVPDDEDCSRGWIMLEWYVGGQWHHQATVDAHYAKDIERLFRVVHKNHGK